MITEFDEQATSKEIALANLKYAIVHYESIGVIGGYELAAVGSGATSEEIELARVDALVSRAVRYPITSLDQLLELMQSNAPSIEDDWDNLPVFGGPLPDSTLGIWSWDATRLIVGTCPNDVCIVSRTEI